MSEKRKQISEQTQQPTAEQALYQDANLITNTLTPDGDFSLKGDTLPIAVSTSPQGIEQKLYALLAAGNSLFAVSEVRFPEHEPKLMISAVSTEPEGSSRLIGVIEVGKSVLIGRGSKTKLDDDTLFRHHFKVDLSPAGTKLMDLGSTNGTLVATANPEELKTKQLSDAKGTALGGLNRLLRSRKKNRDSTPISQSTRWVIPESEVSDYLNELPTEDKSKLGSFEHPHLDPRVANTHELAGSSKRFDFRNARTNDAIEIEFVDGTIMKGKVIKFSRMSEHRDDTPISPRIELLEDYRPLETDREDEVTYYKGDTLGITGAGSGSILYGVVAQHTPLGLAAQQRVPYREVERARNKGYTVDQKGRVFGMFDDGLKPVSEFGYRGYWPATPEVAHFSVTRRTSSNEDRTTKIF